MYCWTILQKSETDLVRAVFNAQREVQGVLKSCEINYIEEEIKKMTPFQLNTIVKEKIQLKVLVYLVKLQNKHTKYENLHLDSMIQKYLNWHSPTSTQERWCDHIMQWNPSCPITNTHRNF